MLKRFILRNKQGGPRTPDLPADEKQKSLSLALVRHGCVFFFPSARLKKTSVCPRWTGGGGSGSVPTFPRCRSAVRCAERRGR